MNYIRPCPSCKSELRFPIDRGTLRVTCPICSEIFLVDPDNTDIYKKGSFDFNRNPKKEKFYPSFDFLSKEKIIRFVIPAILGFLLILNFQKECKQQKLISPVEEKIIPVEEKSTPSIEKPKNEI